MTCPICGEPCEGAVLTNSRGVTTDRWAWCTACRLFFVKDMPSKEQVTNEYASGVYRKDLYESRVKDKRMSRSESFIYEVMGESMRAQYIMIAMENAGVTPKRFLDVGTSMGILPWAVGRIWDGCVVHGVEPYQQYTIFKNLTIFVSLEEVTGTYDTITCIHTLEHVPNPVEFLLEIGKRLELEGRLFVEVPNYVLGGTRSPFSKSHLFAYTVDGLLKVLGMAGFESIANITHGWNRGYGTDANILVIARHRDEKRTEQENKT